jgi:hypothetical protein
MAATSETLQPPLAQLSQACDMAGVNHDLVAALMCLLVGSTDVLNQLHQCDPHSRQLRVILWQLLLPVSWPLRCQLLSSCTSTLCGGSRTPQEATSMASALSMRSTLVTSQGAATQPSLQRTGPSSRN